MQAFVTCVGLSVFPLVKLCLVCRSECVRTPLESARLSSLTKVMPTCIYNTQQFISTMCTPKIILISSFNLWPYNVYHAPDLNDSHFRSLISSFIHSQYDQFSHPYSSASSTVILCNVNNSSVSFDALSENATKFCRKS